MAKGEIFTGMPTWAKGLLAVSLTAGVIWLGYKGYKKMQQKIQDLKDENKQQGNEKAQVSENFTSIPLIIGDAAKLTPKKDAYSVFVTAPNNKVFNFVYYSNGRVMIAPKGGVVAFKGKYYNSGKIITLDNGKSFQYNSVWANMAEILKSI
jgi:septal ring factor EnvC (AmiA/AmiB activator)